MLVPSVTTPPSMPPSTLPSIPPPMPSCTRCGMPTTSAPEALCLQACGLEQYCSVYCRHVRWEHHRDRCHLELGKRLASGTAVGFGWSDNLAVTKTSPRPSYGTFVSCRQETLATDSVIKPTVPQLLGIPLVLMQWTSQQGIEKCDKYSGYGPGTSFGAPSALTRPGLLLTMDPANPQASEERGLLGNDWAAAFREDGKVLTPETMETILAYVLMVIEEMSPLTAFADAGWGSLKEYFTPGAFRMFSRRYFREQREKGRLEFDGPYIPL